MVALSLPLDFLSLPATGRKRTLLPTIRCLKAKDGARTTATVPSTIPLSLTALPTFTMFPPVGVDLCLPLGPTPICPTKSNPLLCHPTATHKCHCCRLHRHHLRLGVKQLPNPHRPYTQTMRRSRRVDGDHKSTSFTTTLAGHRLQFTLMTARR